MTKRFSALAKPIFWSEWQTIEEQTGARSFKITYSGIGNAETLVYGKVKYYKQKDKLVEEEFVDQVMISAADVYASIDVCFKGIPFGTAVEGEIQ